MRPRNPASRHGLGAEFPGRPGEADGRVSGGGGGRVRVGAAGGGRPGCRASGGQAGNARPPPPASQAGRHLQPRPRDPPGDSDWSGAQAPGRALGGAASRKRGPWAPLCEGRRRGAGQPPTVALDACLPAGVLVGPAASPPPLPFGGASRLPPPSSGLLRACPSHTPPAWASVPIGRAYTSIPTHPDTSPLSPPPPLTSLLPRPASAPLHPSPPSGVCRFPPTFRLSGCAAASGCYFSLLLVGVGEGDSMREYKVVVLGAERGWQIRPDCAVCH